MATRGGVAICPTARARARERESEREREVEREREKGRRAGLLNWEERGKKVVHIGRVMALRGLLSSPSHVRPANPPSPRLPCYLNCRRGGTTTGRPRPGRRRRRWTW